MPRIELVASIDQGTQSTRVTLYNRSLQIVASVQATHEQLFPEAGWVEHNPTEIMNNIVSLFSEVVVLAKQKLYDEPFVIKCVGITNQRETSVAWDKETGMPLHNAIVWLDTRTKSVVDDIVVRIGDVDGLRAESGLPVNTYFSGAKMRWMIDNVPAVQEALKAKRCYFGTIDTWIIWNLTGGPKHNGKFVTDVTNASRTQLMDLSTCQWSDKLLTVFGIDRDCLPEIRSCAEIYGDIVNCGCSFFEGVPISGCAGDQQAACIGQGIFRKGQVKCTYGTGAFILINTGSTSVASSTGLLTTPCFQFGPDAPVVYALEGSIAIAGAAITWLKENLGAIDRPSDTEALINSVDNTAGTYFVPAFSGLFAPRWRQDARGCIVGLTQHTKKAHIVRALMESVGFQLHEIVEAMLNDMKMDKLALIRVDGGMSRNNTFLQLTANLCGCTVERPENAEVTSTGAAVAAGLGCGVWSSVDEVELLLASSSRQWYPTMTQEERQRKIGNWNKAVERSLNWV